MGASRNCPGIEMFNTSEAWNGAEARDTRGIRRVGVGARQAGGDRPRNEVSQQLGVGCAGRSEGGGQRGVVVLEMRCRSLQGEG